MYHDVVVANVNAVATDARPEWLASLRPGGRPLVPLTCRRSRTAASTVDVDVNGS